MKAYGRWDVTLPGERYTWEPDEVTVGECLMLEAEAESSYDQWIRDVGNNRAVACQILVWFLRRKEGRQEDRAAVDFPIRKLEITELVGDADPEASAGSEPATSSPSSTGSESNPSSGTA